METKWEVLCQFYLRGFPGPSDLSLLSVERTSLCLLQKCFQQGIRVAEASANCLNLYKNSPEAMHSGIQFQSLWYLSFHNKNLTAEINM